MTLSQQRGSGPVDALWNQRAGIAVRSLPMRTPVLNGQSEVGTIVEPQKAAVSAGLRYVSDARPGIRRHRAGKGFYFTAADGSRIADRAATKRIRALAIPPAWQDVWIYPFGDGHIQATGRDARGRKQYRYHPRFREIRESTKYEHVVGFANALPVIRAKVREHMALPGLPRDKVLATVVYLLDKTLIRVGNDDYAKHNKSYGLTTFKNRHAEVNGSEVRFRFVGKSGKDWLAKIRNRRVAKIIRACQELPGQELLQYRDQDGSIRDVTSGDVNEYLREISGQDITVKDFRTWAGTVLAAVALKEIESFDSQAKAKKNLRAAVEKVAAKLGNTPTICRKCYVHPEVLNAYLDGSLVRDIAARSERILRDQLDGMEPEEAAVLAMLRSRLKSAGNRSDSKDASEQLLASVELLKEPRPKHAAELKRKLNGESHRPRAAAG
jgi:DNA topoisomerase I